MTRQTLLTATVAGIVLGIAYTLSPMGVGFVAACAGLALWAAHGLPERERRWVVGLITVALLSRALVIVVMFLTRDPAKQYFFSFAFDGDGQAMKRRSMWMASFWAGERVDWFEAHGAFDRSYGFNSYVEMLGYLQYLLGPAPYGIHLMNITLFVAGGVLMFRFVRKTYGRLPALAGLALVLFMPTLFLWSVAALKESLQFFLLALAMVNALKAIQATSWRTGLFRAAVAIAIVLLVDTVRSGIAGLVVASVAIGAIGTFVLRRRYLTIASLVAALGAVALLLGSGAGQARLIATLENSATVHIGNVRTEGHGYKTLDEEFYTTSYSEAHPISMTEVQAIRFFLRSMIAFVMVPLPWTLTSMSELAFLPAQLVWYAVIALAFAGFLPGLRRHALLTLTIVAFFFIGALIVGLRNGNAGTLVRLRDLVTPFVVWLSAVGAVMIFVRVAARKIDVPVRMSASSRSVAIESSRVVQEFRRLSAGSWLYRTLEMFVTTPTKYIDGGIPPEEEPLALAHLDRIMQRSRIFTVPAGWLERWRAAWPEATVVGIVTRHVSGVPAAERVRLIGWVLAVAVATETVFSHAGAAAPAPFSLGAKLTVLALAVLFVLAGGQVAAAWNDRTRWTPTNS